MPSRMRILGRSPSSSAHLRPWGPSPQQPARGPSPSHAPQHGRPALSSSSAAAQGGGLGPSGPRIFGPPPPCQGRASAAAANASIAKAAIIVVIAFMGISFFSRVAIDGMCRRAGLIHSMKRITRRCPAVEIRIFVKSAGTCRGGGIERPDTNEDTPRRNRPRRPWRHERAVRRSPWEHRSREALPRTPRPPAAIRPARSAIRRKNAR